MRASLAIPVFLALSGLTAVSWTQSTLSTFAPPAPPSEDYDAFGRAVSGVGDVDGDGVPDIAVASEDDNPSGGGSIRVFSGRDSTTLLTHPTTGNADDIDVSDVGDIDGDGVPDVLYGRPETWSTTSGGYAAVLSGRTSETLLSWSGVVGDDLGHSVACAGDANLDGTPDVVIGAPHSTFLFLPSDVGSAIVYSGSDGSVIGAFFGSATGDRFGHSVDGGLDIDLDGIVEVIAGAPGAGQAKILEPATSGVLRTHGGSSNDAFGAEVAGLGDTNGDNIADYAVAAPAHDKGAGILGAGEFRVYSGWTGGLLLYKEGGGQYIGLGSSLSRAGDLSGDGLADVLVGTNATAGVSSGGYVRAWSVSSGAVVHNSSEGDGELDVGYVGDVNGDGRDDVLVGSPNGVALAGQNRGLVRLYSGSTGNQIRELSSQAGARLGASVAIVGDVDGDGHDDVLVGAPFEDANGLDSGIARLYSGSTGVELRSHVGSEGGWLGAAVASAGDVDGDSVDDYLVGAPGFKFFGFSLGRVLVISGLTGASIRTHLGVVTGERFGATLAGLGDANGDGRADYAVGAPWATGPAGIRTGRVDVISGQTGNVFAALVGSAANGRFGAALGAAGDVNADGLGDVVIGSPRFFQAFPHLSGRVSVYSPLTSTQLWSKSGTESNALYASAVDGIGDLNGDGRSEVIVGAPLGDTAVVDSGRAWVLSGLNGAALATHEGSAGEKLGTAVRGLGDVDNDGVPDYAVGEPRAKTLIGAIPFPTGAVRVYSGATNAVLHSHSGDLFGGGLGSALGAGGDVDGDGLRDLVAGEPELAGTADHAGGASALGTRARGSEHYGTGTPGCNGVQLLTLSLPASIGTTVEVRSDAVGPTCFPTLVFSWGQLLTGSDPFGLGALLHVDPFQTILTRSAAPPAGDHLAIPLPVPNDPGLVDTTLYAQEILLWLPGCPSLPLGLSSSTGLTVTIQQ
jgi:hypothetical protein